MCQRKEVWKHWEKYQELFVNEFQTKPPKKSRDKCLLFPYFSSQVLKVVQVLFAPGTFLDYEGFMESFE